MSAIDAMRIAARTLTYQSVSRARTDSKGLIVNAFGQRVPRAAACMNQFHAIAVVDLSTQALDVNLDQVRVGIEGVVPHVFGDVDSRRHLALAPRQVFEQGKFLGGQRDVVTGPDGRARS